jgi:D-alanyl-D-alanine carboxypeptidase
MLKTLRCAFRSVAMPLLAACVLGLISTSAATAQAAVLGVASSEPRYAAIVVDASSGEVLYGQNADSPRYPASITKVMTLYLTFEALSEGRLKLTDRIVYSPHAAAQPATKLNVQAGDSITVDEAIKGMTVKSANDAAVAMAERLAGSESRFAALMTLRGQELGMRNTRFVNPHGLPDSRNISTARDLAILSRAIMRDFPQYYSYFGLKGFSFRGTYVPGHKRLLDSMPGFDGLKTGFTNASGYNLAGSAARGGRRLIAVVLGGRSAAWRDDNMEDLLLTGFDVLDRRRHGERTTIAENLYTDINDGPVTRPAIGQGDGEQEGLKVILTDLPRSTRPAAAPPPAAKSAKASPKTPAKGEWTIQVGAFKSRQLAKEQLSLIGRKVGGLVSQADGAVETAGGLFKAQFQGLTSEAARSACSAISAKRQPCMVLAPR